MCSLHRIDWEGLLPACDPLEGDTGTQPIIYIRFIACLPSKLLKLTAAQLQTFEAHPEWEPSVLALGGRRKWGAPQRGRFTTASASSASPLPLPFPLPFLLLYPIPLFLQQHLSRVDLPLSQASWSGRVAQSYGE
eukprot:GHVU01171086.1.p1 GENE.GHVU01171086.1~~GHVU01171086.1.p1  ORF type:complete len:135 (-),score=4.66 GHVU01171086.1:98-502(-)